MKTIQITDENGKFAGTISTECKPATKVLQPYYNSDFELVVPSHWSGARLNQYLKSSEGKKAKKAAQQQGASEETAVQGATILLTIATTYEYLLKETTEQVVNVVPGYFFEYLLNPNDSIKVQKSKLTKYAKEATDYLTTLQDMQGKEGTFFFWHLGQRLNKVHIVKAKKDAIVFNVVRLLLDRPLTRDEKISFLTDYSYQYNLSNELNDKQLDTVFNNVINLHTF